MSEFYLTAGRKRSKETYHTDPECPTLQRRGKQSTTERYIISKDFDECKYCRGDNKITYTNNREVYNALENADPGDLTAD